MKPVVLVVDDEHHILKAIKRLLHRDPYHVVLANGGREALAVLSELDVALIICDQRMPAMSGSEVLAEAYKIRPDAYRITLTGYTDLEAAQRSINDGHIDQFVTKPWQDGHLRQLVAQGVSAHQLVRENRRLERLTRQQNAQLQDWNKKLEEQVQLRTKMLVFQNKKLVGLQKRMEDSLRDTVGVLAGMLEMFSPALGIHSKRVAALARRIGVWLEVDQESLWVIEIAAYLHDVGKIATLAAKNQKDGASRRGVLAYPEAGYTILADVAGFENIAEGVRYQAVPFDSGGSGDAMNGEQIPLASRIIALANGYDTAVFSSVNPTQPDRRKGRAVLLAGKGRVYDPKLVELVMDQLEAEDGKVLDDAEVGLSPRQLKAGMVVSRDLETVENVLLLKAGTELTPSLIERINTLCNGDLLLSTIYVKCVSHPSEGETIKDKAVDNQVVTESSAVEAKAEVEAPPCDRLPAKKKLLIVDDVQLVCHSIARVLGREDFETQSTDDGRIAVGLAGSEQIDLVITDLAMPKMNGETLIEHLQRVAPQTSCIVLTGNATKKQRAELSRTTNVRAVLTKPWEAHQLLEAVHMAIDTRPRVENEEAA